MENEIRYLIHKRGIIKTQLTRLKTYLNEFSNNPNMDQLQSRAKKLEETWNTFNDIQTELELNDTMEKHEREREIFEDTYYELMGLINKIQSDNTPTPINTAFTNQSEATTSPNTNQLSNTTIASNNLPTVKLPKIQLPRFNGDYNAWLGFQDSFRSIIHNNDTLPNVQKLHYLRSCLSGEPEQLIQSLESIEGNYDVAWSLLQETYDNHRIIIQKHIKDLFELPNITNNSSNTIRSMINSVQQHVRALKTLKQPVDKWDAILIYLISSKLDKTTRREWDRSIKDKSEPTYDELLAFLRTTSQYVDSITPGTSASTTHQPNNKISHNKRGNPGQTQNSKYQTFIGTRYKSTCPICKQDHYIQHCEKFLQQSINEKWDTIKRLSLCSNCLRSNHSTDKCLARSCLRCYKRHNTLLHPLDTNKNQDNIISTPSTSTTHLKTLLTATSSEVLLPTAIIHFLDKSGNLRSARVILDSASQSNFITENLAFSLGLQLKQIQTSISGLNQMITQIKHLVQAEIKSADNKFTTQLTFFTIPQITDQLPSEQIDISSMKLPKNVTLADPEFHKPANIDGIIGAEIFYTLLCIGQIELNLDTKRPVLLQKTRLGWIVAGRVPTGVQSNKKPVCHTSIEINNQLTKFWEIEELPQQKYLSSEEQACELHFQQTTKRDQSGRYIVKLPFNSKLSSLGTSYDLALKRFTSLQRKLNKQSEFKRQYNDFIDEYNNLGHMSIYTCKDKTITKEGYFLPHHAVVKEASTTTKLRVVFDGSAKTSSGISLNDTLFVGPTIQSDLISLILRFRFHAYVLTADIEKMYRQILVDKDDRKYQRILWQHNENEPIKIYELNTITYGLASAPFQAVRCLHQLAEDEGKQYPFAAKILQQDFYVDDLLTGANSYEEAAKLRDELTNLLKLGGFNLRQWNSNEPKLLNDLSEHNLNKQLLLDSNKTVKALGINWNSNSDTISYTVKLPSTTLRISKRTILSQIAQLFDPLGLLGPIIVKAKIILQELWKARIDWDESVPNIIQSAWINFKNQLNLINNISFQRNSIILNTNNIQLHGFCDASERAYGACIYIRSTDEFNNISVSLLCSKSRIAPLKSTSLPRLELCAALLLSKLYSIVIQAYNINYNEINFWSDSTITLQWINTSPHMLKIFVANRVAEIQKYTNSKNWRYVPTHDNPADHLSKGQNPNEFIKNDRWKSGPHWLHENQEKWPNKLIQIVEIPEQRKFVTLHTYHINYDILTQYSSINRLIRIIAYCLRFKNKPSYSKWITSDELLSSHNRVIKLTQMQTFNQEYHDLSETKLINKKSRLLSLNPFLDDDGIMRVGGRLKHANLNYNQKYPIILPKNHHITNLIIQDAHIKHGHSGVQATLYAIRRRYWPIGGRNHIRKIIHKCIKCFHVKPPIAQQLMGNLPRDRITETRPFKIIGIDYCGPFFIKEKRYRNTKRIKAYVVIFICFVTKAIHIELVSDLTTEAFLASLRRFVARRGKCSNIYSDNATTFAGANNHLSITSLES